MTSEVQGRREATGRVFTPAQVWLIGGAGALAVATVVVWAVSAAAGTVPWTYAGALLATQQIIRGESPLWVMVVAGVLLVALLGGALTVALRRAARPTPGAGMANRVAVRAAAGEDAARQAATYTRRRSIAAGLDIERCPVNEVGLELGSSLGEPVIITNQTQTAVIGPTGAGKTRFVLCAAAADACGAAVITTTKLRDYVPAFPARRRLGQIIVFDPMDTGRWPEAMFWDPIEGATDPTVAYARGAAFAGGMSDDSSDQSAGKFFADACTIIMARLLLAAAVSDKTMRDVLRWASLLRSAGPEPVRILRAAFPANPIYADSLAGYVSGDGKTTANIQMTMAIKIEVLMSDRVLDRLTPRPGALAFHPESFVRSTDTLVIVTDDNARTNVAPLATMLLNEVMDAAKDYAGELSGMIDPPMRIVGDEIANVAPIPKLPSMLSDSRGAGVQWFIAYQSQAGLIARWGEHSAKLIEANLNASLVLPGLQDVDALRRFSDLAGKVEVVEAASSVDSSGRRVASTSYTRHERAVMRPEEIQHMSDGEGFLLVRNGRSLRVKLTPFDAR